ncbi:MAG: transposase [Rubricoccaceae bacterium]
MRRHRRRSVRLPAFDYGQPGLYFVTLCTFGRQPVFGTVRAGEMRRSAFGEIADEEWSRTPDLRAGVGLDAFVVMPDHVHLLFGIVGDDISPITANARRGTARCAPTPDDPTRQFGEMKPQSVPVLVRAYKSAVTRRIRQLDPTVRVWQRGYYDRIVRNENEADAIRRYIAENPVRWAHRTTETKGHRI